jgi:hypothetical protein
MREAKQGGCARKCRAFALGNAVRIREARQVRCARRGSSDARVKAGQLREASPGSYAR